MHTTHHLLFQDARTLHGIDDQSIDLVVTSPPYPMIEMWDDLFTQLNPTIGQLLSEARGHEAFEAMHQELDQVWQELWRVVKPGGFVCINIGDATRTIGTEFQIYSNHSRITHAFMQLSFHTLPLILWRQTTNAPNKFMGSGMLPAGAYVTLEHEYILIFRKGGKRRFLGERAKSVRQKSAIFWEERNIWFSDIWSIQGVRQETNRTTVRERSAAYPFELAYRLIHMYSVKGDIVLDPFLGTGTTIFAAIAAARNSIGVEIDTHFQEIVHEELPSFQERANTKIQERLSEHKAFVHTRIAANNGLKYTNKPHHFPVMTRQEQEMELEYVEKIAWDDDRFCIQAEYHPLGRIQEFIENPLSMHVIAPSQHEQIAMF
jgi:DNA modification methylase